MTSGESLAQLPSPQASQIDFKSARLQLRWINPPDNTQMAPSYSFSLPRYVCYKRDVDRTAIRSASGAAVNWSAIRLEALPKVFLIYCQPKENPSTSHETFFTEHTGLGINPVVGPAAANASGVHRDDQPLFIAGANKGCCSFQDTYDVLPGDEGVDDWQSAKLKITLNETSSLCATFSARQLYEILISAFPGYKYDYSTWRKSKCIIALRPSDIPTVKMASVYSPTTCSIEVTFKAADAHDAPGPQYVAFTQASNFKAVPYQSSRTHVNLNKVPHEATLMAIYEDSLTLASGSAGVAATLFSESALRKKPTKEKGPALDGMQM